MTSLYCFDTSARNASAPSTSSPAMSVKLFPSSSTIIVSPTSRNMPLSTNFLPHTTRIHNRVCKSHPKRNKEYHYSPKAANRLAVKKQRAYIKKSFELYERLSNQRA